MLLKLPAPHHHLDHHFSFNVQNILSRIISITVIFIDQGASLWNTGLSTTVENGRVDKGQVPIVITRVAQSAEAQKRRCTKILVVDENLDPQHTLFCHEIVFVANYALKYCLRFPSEIFV